MAQKYRKIDPRIWRDEKFRKFNQQQKLVTLYALTAQSNRIGIFVFSLGQASEELDTPLTALGKTFQSVVAALRWKWDPNTRVLFIPKWWRYNQPENANNVIGNLKDLEDLPETPLIEQFCKNTMYLQGHLLETFAKTIEERYRNVTETFAKGSPSQEQEQEQEQDIPPNPQGGVTDSLGYSPEFEIFWANYPKHVGKGAAYRAWQRLRPSKELQQQILSAIAKQTKSSQWRNENGRYIPNPATWLNQRRWDDEPLLAAVVNENIRV